MKWKYYEKLFDSSASFILNQINLIYELNLSGLYPEL